MHILYDFPLWVLGFLVVSMSVGVGLAGVWMVRRRNWMLDPGDNDTAGLAHGFIGVLYAVALGLMVVGVQGRYSEVETVVMKEANLAGDLYFDLEGIDEPERSEFQGLTRRYIEAVIEDEWPAVAAGGESASTEAIAALLARRIITYQPSSDLGLLVFAEVLDGLNELLDQRRERLHLGTSGIGAVTWAIVLIGALITIGVACFYHTTSLRAHSWLVAMMSAMFGLMMFLIVAMDHPLWGNFSPQPDGFHEVLREVQAWASSGR